MIAVTRYDDCGTITISSKYSKTSDLVWKMMCEEKLNLPCWTAVVYTRYRTHVCVNCTVVLKHWLKHNAFVEIEKCVNNRVNGDLLIPYGVSNFNFYFKKQKVMPLIIPYN